MFKAELRQQFARQRKSLATAFLEKQSQLIAETFFEQFDLSQINYLHVFLPILKQNEIDTWLIIHRIWRYYPHITLVTAKSDIESYRMFNYVLKQDTLIVENTWGIPEPLNAMPCQDQWINMVLIPLLCFDRQGFRVGYGKGFYDRFLEKCRPTTVKVGLSLFEPVDTIIDIHAHDAKMDFCIVDGQVFTFKA